MARTLGLLAALLAILLWTFGGTIIELENYRNANSMGLCDEASADYANDPQARMRRDQCLAGTSTRTNGIWHLGYALGIF